MIKQYFKEYLDLFPSLGSYIGRKKYNSHYENNLDTKFKRKFIQMQKEYHHVLKQKNIETIDNAILLWVTSIFIEGEKFDFDLMPLTSFHNSIIDFTFNNNTNYPLEKARDIKDLILRYKAFHKYINSCKKMMRKGIVKGYVIPKIICKKMISYLKKHITNKDYVLQIPDHLKSKYPKLYATYLQSIDMHYMYPVKDLLNFIEQEYYPSCRNSIGLCGLPNGKAMYEFCVKQELTMENTSISEIHQYGVDEIFRISQDMQHIKEKLGYPSNMPLQVFYRHMKTDPKYQVTNVQELLVLYNQKKDDIKKNVLPKYFDFDVAPYEIKPVPNSIEKTTAAAFYMSANKNTKRPGTFYINCQNLENNFTYSIAPLTLHEGEPGHHYQFQYLIDMKIPDYRIYLLHANVFIEGWALYCENFIDNSDPLQQFGKLTFELYRATRLVIDTGIHYYGWSYKKAAKYMQDNVPLGDQQIQNEIERYICIPGQALCYKIGEREILKLRKKFCDKFGDTPGALKRFHRILLEDGNLPLQVLQNKINKMRD